MISVRIAEIITFLFVLIPVLSLILLSRYFTSKFLNRNLVNFYKAVASFPCPQGLLKKSTFAMTTCLYQDKPNGPCFRFYCYFTEDGVLICERSFPFMYFRKCSRIFINWTVLSTPKPLVWRKFWKFGCECDIKGTPMSISFHKVKTRDYDLVVKSIGKSEHDGFR